MPKHDELVSISVQDGRYRLCLDQVIRDDEDKRTEYALVWRGTSVSSNGFIPRPAYFSITQLGYILHKGIPELGDQQIAKFFKALAGVGKES